MLKGAGTYEGVGDCGMGGDEAQGELDDGQSGLFCELGELLVAKPSVVFTEFRLVCRVAHGFSPPESIHCNAQQSLRTEIPLATDGFARGIEAFFDRFATPASTRLLDRSEFPIGSQFRTTRDPSRVKKIANRVQCVFMPKYPPCQ